MSNHKHDWAPVGRVDYDDWVKKTHWCNICGTIRWNDYYDKYHYQRPKLTRPLPRRKLNPRRNLQKGMTL